MAVYGVEPGTFGKVPKDFEQVSALFDLVRHLSQAVGFRGAVFSQAGEPGFSEACAARVAELSPDDYSGLFHALAAEYGEFLPPWPY